MLKRANARILASAILAAAVTACSAPEEMVDQSAAVGARAQADSGSGTATTATATATTQTSGPAGAYEFKDDTKKDGSERTFTYAWPREVSAIPKLAADLEKRRAKALAEQKRSWTELVEDCPPDAISCRTNAFELIWQVVADTPRFLSLSNSLYVYSGGAHGNYGRDGVVWNRKSERLLQPVDLFVSPQALGTAIRPAACAALNKDREKRRGQPVPQGAAEWPDQCPDLDKTVLFLGSSDGNRFDRIGIYYAPYAAPAPR